MDIFSGIDWTTDVYPKIQDFLATSLVQGPLVFIIVIVLALFAVSQFIKTWSK